MKIYLISQEENGGYDTYDAAVVYAPDEEAARRIHPLFSKFNQHPWDIPSTAWCRTPEEVKVQYLGEAVYTVTEPGLILGSFNAG